MDDTAALLQMEYDRAVHDFGVDSKQAKQAELAAQQFFTGNPPLEPVSLKPVPALTTHTKGADMTEEWEVVKKLPKFDDRSEFDVQIYGKVRRAKLAGNDSVHLAPGTWHFTDCTHPYQDMLFDRNDVTAWRHHFDDPKEPTAMNNFCARCGKRTGGALDIHTCTPTPERQAMTDTKQNALYDRLGGRPERPTYNESKTEMDITMTAKETDSAWVQPVIAPLQESDKPRVNAASFKWLNPSHIRLIAGEVTTSEMRCILAVVKAFMLEVAPREWVGLTKEEAADCWSIEAVRTWHAIEAKLKEKNNAN